MEYALIIQNETGKIKLTFPDRAVRLDMLDLLNTVSDVTVVISDTIICDANPVECKQNYNQHFQKNLRKILNPDIDK